LTHLTFGAFFDQQLEVGVLPLSLTELDLNNGRQGKGVLVVGGVPASCHVCMRDRFSNNFYDLPLSSGYRSTCGS